MIDTHCHLNDPKFAEDARETLERARESGITGCLVVGYDAASSRRAVEMAEFPLVWIALGVHPHDALSTLENPGWLADLEESLRAENRVAAIGEMGLDYHYDFAPREAQRDVFREQARLARTLELPMTIHSREAEDEVMDILAEEGGARAGGALHAFTGSSDQLDRALEMGLHIGVGGMVTFKKAGSLRAVIRRAPLERVLLETDAPYLAPHPLRGKRNEPAFLVHVRRALAEMYGCSEAQVDQQTTRNALGVFRRMGETAS